MSEKGKFQRTQVKKMGIKRPLKVLFRIHWLVILIDKESPKMKILIKNGISLSDNSQVLYSRNNSLFECKRFFSNWTGDLNRSSSICKGNVYYFS